MPVDIQYHQQDAGEEDIYAPLTADFEYAFFIVSHKVADVSKNPNPYAGSSSSVEAELPDMHSGKPCGERDILTYPYDQPPYESADVPVSSEKNFPLCEMLFGKTEVFAIPDQERPSKVKGDDVVKKTAEHASGSP